MKYLGQKSDNEDIASLEDLIPKTSTAGKVLKSTSTAGVVEWGDVGGGGSATDVQINGTSITNNDVANIITNTAYNASSNKIATMSDVPTTTDNVTQSSTSALTSGGAYTALPGKQDTLGSSNKLNADYISDGTINKVFTTTEQTKLNGIAAGAEVNVQSDWNQTDTDADDYIKNKPTIPNAITITTTSGSESISDGSNTVNVVTRNTAQTISGAKTFSNAITLNGGISGTPASLAYNSADLAFQYDYVKLSSYVTNSTTTTTQKTFNIQTITGDTNTSHVYEIYGSWHLYKTSTCYGWLWSDLWGYSSGTSTPFLNPTANSRVSQTAFVVPCYAKTDGLKAIIDTTANESFIAIYGYRRIK